MKLLTTATLSSLLLFLPACGGVTFVASPQGEPLARDSQTCQGVIPYILSEPVSGPETAPTVHTEVRGLEVDIWLTQGLSDASNVITIMMEERDDADSDELSRD